MAWKDLDSPIGESHNTQLLKGDALSSKKTFESSLTALEVAVEKLEQGDLPLEEALACFEEGVKAAGSCQKLLKEAELKIEKLRFDESGELVKEPFSDDEAGK